MHLLYCKQITYHLLWTYYIHPHSGNILLNNCIPFDNQHQNLDTDMVVHSHSRWIQQNNLKRCYIIFCFLEFYSLFVRMDYINIKKSSHSVRTSVYPKMILVFFSWELYHLLHGNQGPHRSYKCAYMRKSKQMSTRCHVISCWYM